MSGPHSGRAKRAQDRRQVGLQQVAALADVSIASVSRVLNKKGNVTEEIRERVESACAELGYVPNGAARALSSQKTRAVGAVVPSIENSGFASVIAALQQRLAIDGYTLLLASSGYDPVSELDKVRALLAHGIDGIVLVGDQHDPQLIPMLERKGVVYVETWTLSHERPCVGFDNMSAAGRIVDYLLDLGHAEISVITGRSHFNDRAAARVRGIETRLRNRNLRLHSQVVVEHPYRILDGRLAARSLLSAQDRPTAIICGNDQLAFGAIIEAASQGVDVPRDISITGFNDVDYAAHLDPPLTTMRIQADEIGMRAGDYIVRRLADEPVMAVAEVEVSLIVRGSTAAPRPRRTVTRARNVPAES